jgi:phosphatidylethanolamine-binding protein (PEBP) family uncharacterized protein
VLGVAKHDVNDFRRHGYGGPCPPGGTHRYFFRLYAVDKVVEMKAGATKDEILRVREKTTLQSIALRFRSNLVDLDRKRSLSYTEDSAREDRTKMAWK